LVFKANEAVGNCKHVGLKIARLLFRHSRERFLSDFQDLGLPVSRSFDFEGKPRCCHVCGYAIIDIELDRGWTLETCSAMPILLLTSPLFAAWRKRVPPERQPSARLDKLPTSCS
jgi:hypothetical protein